MSSTGPDWLAFVLCVLLALGGLYTAVTGVSGTTFGATLTGLPARITGVAFLLIGIYFAWKSLTNP